MNTSKNSNDLPQHPYVAFAKRHQGKWEATLSAYFALERAKAIRDDAIALKPFSIQRDQSEDRAPWDRNGFEIADYYVVGLVTCLEWHAKSRLRDLLTFFPDTLTPNDIKDAITHKAMAEAIANKLSVIDLIAASIRISSAEAYVRQISRLFTRIGVEKTVWEIVDELDIAPKYEVLKHTKKQNFIALFETRNHLVHEIDSSVFGHALRRTPIEIDTAINWTSFAVSLIERVENLVSENTPREFPNKLTHSGYPADELTLIREEISELEKAIHKSISTSPDPMPSNELPRFEECMRTWQKLHNADTEFISRSMLLHSRFMDFQTPFLRALLAARRDHLAELSTWYETFS